MKTNVFLFSLLFSFLTLTNIYSQDCIDLPDTIFHCGFSLEVQPNSNNLPAFFGYTCQDGPGNVDFDEVEPGIYEITFSECGTYEISVFIEECQEFKVVIFEIDDPSYTITEIVGANTLEYNNVSCHSDGSSCDNEVTIEGELPPDPEWDICYEMFCEFKHYFTITTPTNPIECIADEIVVDSIEGSSSSSGCLPFDAADVTAENFCDIVDQFYSGALNNSECQPAPAGCFDVGIECIDSITYDTLLIPFPIHDGGRWTMLEGTDTIILSDTTYINKYMKDLLFVIEPGADYYGPGDLTFSLFELIGGDTFPTAFDASFVLWWQELWHYDTITQIVQEVHYSDDPACVSCGGNSVSTSKNIPEIPEYLCPAITISFGDPCSCENADIVLTGNSIDCYNPCADLSASVTFDAGSTILSDEWTDSNGNIIGSGQNITVCEGGLYTYSVISDPFGCEYSESFFIDEDFNAPVIIGTPTLVIDCFNDCVLVEFFIEDNPNQNQIIEGTCVYPDGSSVDFQGQPEPTVVCEPGTVNITVTNVLNGCTTDFNIEILEEYENIDFNIETPELITCNNDCVDLIVNEINIPQPATYTWNGPNGFTSNTLNTNVCEEGIYSLTILYGNCEQNETVEVLSFFQPVNVNESFEVCEGDCIIFGGEIFCDPGSYSFEGLCDTTWNLELIVLLPDMIDKYEFICEGEQVLVDGIYYDTEGIYPYELFDNICATQVTLEIEVFEMDLFVSGIPSLDCINNSTELQVSTSNPETNFFWYDSDGNVVATGDTYTATSPGMYIVQNVSSNNQCVAEVIVDVSGSLDPPEFDLLPTGTINCEDEIQISLSVDENDDLVFFWTGPGVIAGQETQQNPFVNSPGTYEVVITNEFGCAETAEIIVLGVEPMDVSISSDNSCLNEASGRVEIQVEFGGIGPFTYQIGEGEFQEDPIFENVPAGEYIVTVLQDDGCDWQGEIEVESIDAIEPTLGIAQTYELCDNPILEFDLSEDLENHEDWQIEWHDGSSASKRVFTEEGSYSLEISNTCEIREYLFNVEDSRIQDDIPIYIANMFTPNNDGVNDFFQLHTKEVPHEFSIDIYDRWGSLVFKSEDIDFSWNGNHHDITAKSDVFAYIVKYSYLECDNQEKEFTLIGDVTLIR